VRLLVKYLLFHFGDRGLGTLLFITWGGHQVVVQSGGRIPDEVAIDVPSCSEKTLQCLLEDRRDCFFRIKPWWRHKLFLPFVEPRLFSEYA